MHPSRSNPKRWRWIRKWVFDNYRKCHVCGKVIRMRRKKNGEMQYFGHADHVIPVHLDRSKQWDYQNNIRPCCIPCHRKKTWDEIKANPQKFPRFVRKSVQG